MNEHFRAINRVHIVVSKTRVLYLRVKLGSCASYVLIASCGSFILLVTDNKNRETKKKENVKNNNFSVLLRF